MSAANAAAKQKPPKPLSVCTVCAMSFKKLEHLQRHMRTHTHDRPYSCAYAGCGKAFARQDTLTRHAKLHTRDEQEGNKPRARRRTKSVSDAAILRKSVSLPPSQPKQPIISNGFNYQPAPMPAMPALSSSVPSNSRLSTLELLGLSYPPDQQPYSPLPTISELYPHSAPVSTIALPNASDRNAFTSFSPLSNSLFLPALSEHASPVLSHLHLESPNVAISAAALSPFGGSAGSEDDGSISSYTPSDPSSSFIPSSYSSLATSVDSVDCQPAYMPALGTSTRMDMEPNSFPLPSNDLGLFMSQQLPPNFRHQRSPSYPTKSLEMLAPLDMGQPSLAMHSPSDDDKLMRLFRAADIPAHLYAWSSQIQEDVADVAPQSHTSKIDDVVSSVAPMPELPRDISTYYSRNLTATAVPGHDSSPNVSSWTSSPMFGKSPSSATLTADSLETRASQTSWFTSPQPDRRTSDDFSWLSDSSPYHLTLNNFLRDS